MRPKLRTVQVVPHDEPELFHLDLECSTKSTEIHGGKHTKLSENMLSLGYTLAIGECLRHLLSF